MCQIVIKPNEIEISAEEAVLTALALGSSIAVCIYDDKNRIGGMAYAILPEMKDGAEKRGGLRFVNEAVEVLYEKMLEHGAQAGHMWGKLAGGARIFCFAPEEHEADIGKMNVEQARIKLQMLGIPILAEDTGENYGRTVYFHVRDGSLR
ncbi:chemotaxis protein CheD [Clostridium sp. AM58-1XD]|uniref:chemotaxis protein CheD n=1 Tax=Clostridium sp. AM58-1XD TaxID=2292307 RepID=UPI0015F4F568|nr:chemotaxis protein CheD [Clostridium sp. AM58-1XD]